MTVSNFSLLALHLLAAAGCVQLYRQAPCWMQKLVMGMLAATMSIASLAYAVSLFGGDYWPVLVLALVVEHIAILLYLFRLSVQGIQWIPSSDRFPSSLD